MYNFKVPKEGKRAAGERIYFVPRADEKNRQVFSCCVGVWRSLVARRVWDAEAAGSNPVTPTKNYSEYFDSFDGALKPPVLLY